MRFWRNRELKKKRLLPGLMACAIAPFLTSCATNTLGDLRPIGVDTSTVCRTFGPITISPSDTKETQEQALRHDAVWEELCQTGGKEK